MSRKTKMCKECGEEFSNEKLTKYCGKCLSKKKREEMREFYKNNGNWKRKLKWRNKLTLVKVKVPTEEIWNNDFIPAITTEECKYGQCNEHHREDKIYYHPFMKEAYVFGLDLESIEELIDEIKEEIRKGKTTVECLEMRGLDSESILGEEINKEEDD